MEDRTQRGLTLVELLVALVILAVGLLGTMRMQLFSIHSNAFGGRMTTAVLLAQERMERLINQPIDPWPSAPITGSEADPIVLGRQYQSYTVSWTITPDNPIADVANINVQVSWPGSDKPITLVGTKRR